MHQVIRDVYHIRLNTGEDLISEISWPDVKPGSESHVVLHNPMKIVALPSTKAGFVQLSLMQWIFSKISASQEFNVFSRDILTMSTPNESLVSYYYETIDYFDKKSTNTVESSLQEYIDDFDDELKAVEESDRIVEEGEELDPELERKIFNLLNSLSSNNKGTLH